jgi:glycosyltransferase involved in cell wall biosynthesis
MLRVALDATPLITPAGGIRRYVEQLHRALTALHPHDEFTLLSDQLQRPSSWLARRWWLLGLPAELQRRQVQVFHGCDFRVPLRGPTPCVMTLHDLSPWRDVAGTSSAVRRFARWMRWRARRIITPSEAIRREAILRFALPLEKVKAIPLAPSLPIVRQARAARTVLYVGALEDRKNLPVLIGAVLPQPDVRLILCGHSRPGYQVPQHERIEVRQGVSDAELPALYATCTVFAYPSHYEGFGLPILEAMAAGAPVITSQDPALRETAGGAALHCGEGDWQEALRTLLADPARQHAMSRQGEARAAQFSWQETARLTHALYKEVASA